VLQEIKVTEGTTVGVNTIVGTIAVDGEAAAAPAKSAPAKTTPAPLAPKEEKKAATTPAPAPAAPSQEEEEEARSSPLVRKIAREHGVSLSQVTGTGLGGRITKQDIMQFIEGQGSTQPAPVSASPAQPAAAAPAPRPAAPAPYPGDLVPMSNMRRLI